jgi:hypothetical protein
MGVARPLSPLPSLEVDRYLTARYTGDTKDHPLGTPLGIGIGYRKLLSYSPLAFPEPGYLAAQHLQLVAESTSDYHISYTSHAG